MNLPDSMHAMVLHAAKKSLEYTTLPVPVPGTGQILIKVIACGVCRTDLHIIDGELAHPRLPLIPGHEVVGSVVKTGEGITLLKEGDVVGIPWLGYTCGQCDYCLSGRENLCDQAMFTGYTMNGGYAEYMVAYEQYCFPLAPPYTGISGAPLLCAGLIGYRSYSMLGEQAEKIGIYGFGAAAHILIQLANFQHKQVYAFTRRGDNAGQAFARELGAVWVGDSSQPSPVQLDGAIIFAPAGELVPHALANTRKGGTVVCGGIHMSDIPSFPYHLLWEERAVRSVANLTRKDGDVFLKLAPQIPVHTTTQAFPLQQANEALACLRAGKLQGAAVLVMDYE